jgi:hypothetical protein
VLMAEQQADNSQEVAPSTPPPLPIVQQEVNNEPDAEPYYQTTDFEPATDRRWPSLVGYALVAVLVAVLLVLGSRWTYHKLSHKSSDNVAVNNNKTYQQPKTNPTTPPAKTTPSPTPTPTPTPTAPGQGSNLPNNGPGGTVAIFIASTFVASALHYVVSARRQASNL